MDWDDIKFLGFMAVALPVAILYGCLAGLGVGWILIQITKLVGL